MIEITSLILPTKDRMGDGFRVDKILDKTGMKGTGASPHFSTVAQHIACPSKALHSAMLVVDVQGPAVAGDGV